MFLAKPRGLHHLDDSCRFSRDPWHARKARIFWGVLCVIIVQFCRPWKTATIDSSRSGWLSIECQRSERGRGL